MNNNKNMNNFKIQGNIVDIKSEIIFWGTINVIEGKINSILNEGEEKIDRQYIIPGFIDSHVHIESSMLVPSEFAKLAVVHGTIGTISDPHEIANVCGIEGVKYMIENAKTVPFKCTFGAPSCVPATIFETAGASINSVEVDELLQMPEIKYLSEMMNFPGVLNQDSEVLKKIASAKIGNASATCSLVNMAIPKMTPLITNRYLFFKDTRAAKESSNKKTLKHSA